MKYETALIGRVIRNGNLFTAQVIDRSGNVIAEEDHLPSRTEAKKKAERLETEEIYRRLK